MSVTDIIGDLTGGGESLRESTRGVSFETRSGVRKGEFP